MPSGQSHTGFIPTGLVINELNFMRDNGKLDAIKTKVPDYLDSDLTVNNYNLYTKSFAGWRAECQRRYSTLEV